MPGVHMDQAAYGMGIGDCVIRGVKEGDIEWRYVGFMG